MNLTVLMYDITSVGPPLLSPPPLPNYWYLLPLIEVGKKNLPTIVHKLRLLYPHFLCWRHENDWTVVGVVLFQPYRYGYVVLVAWRQETWLVTNMKPYTSKLSY